ncbi:uncharacterized protein BP01DRAFT_132701 [Aspergillus saccharolyticus JOP 1030-1]|uniref:Uncharacterized protein n=1 Tax=Aspergillus saccharolyticus JOP 1030-1 TaxID=1450539 RepID=A0A319A4W6_9EURO|nr:hypothetical protein BP01DRAFT_132701 [Aspergillus saccharolyticus JOP 1030-1]PYH42462.1 hypothetical protein BP01DRAFT_132701 [Aspergillus saccharolyticus JOP 1030-1]
MGGVCRACCRLGAPVLTVASSAGPDARWQPEIANSGIQVSLDICSRAIIHPLLWLSAQFCLLKSSVGARVPSDYRLE